MKLVPRKLRKALDREVPWDLIPEHQHELYRKAMAKEWNDWLSWGAVEVLTLAQSRAIWSDPIRRKWIIPCRFAFRNKHAAMDPRELARKGLDLVEAKARLCIQGFRQVDKHKLRKDSPALSRCGFFCILQTCLDYGFVMFGGDAKSAFMQGGADPTTDDEQELYMSQPRKGTLPDMVKGQLCKLVGSAYGKVNAPRLWWRVIIGYLASTGWTRHSMDASVAMYYGKKQELLAVLGIHVDDILGGCLNESVIQPLRDRFKWGSFAVGASEYLFCGRRVCVKLRTSL